jgi:hypothetical protein
MPKNLKEFYEIIDNIIYNTKKNGIVLITLPSLESKTFSYILYADYLYKSGNSTDTIYKKVIEAEKKDNFNSFGYLFSNDELIQKHWLKEEILFRLSKYNFKSIKIKKIRIRLDKTNKRKQL